MCGLALGLGLGENRLAGLAGEQALELVLVDRLALDQKLGDLVELVDVLGEDGSGPLVRFLDDAADLVVDLARDLLGVVGGGGHVTAEEGHVMLSPEHTRSELLAHAVAHDHVLGRLGDFLEVVGGPGRHLVEDELLGGASAERHRHLVGERRLRREEPVLGRQRDRVAERLATADDRDLVNGVAVRQVVADERVPHLVVGRDLALRHNHGVTHIFRQMSAKLKTLIDQSEQIHKQLGGKVGGAFTSSGGTASGAETTLHCAFDAYSWDDCAGPS